MTVLLSRTINMKISKKVKEYLHTSENLGYYMAWDDNQKTQVDKVRNKVVTIVFRVKTVV